MFEFDSLSTIFTEPISKIIILPTIGSEKRINDKFILFERTNR